MKIFDCFTFFNEIDLCIFRMRLLNNVVDFFVISEANLTHSGKPKPYYFKENKDRFKEWEHKIIYYPIELSTEGLQFKLPDFFDSTDASWILENTQRNALLYLNEMVKDDDIVMISDVDEIPNPEILRAIESKALRIFTAKSMIQSFHYFWMNYRMRGRDEHWRGTVIVPGTEFLRNTPQDFRDNRNNYNAISYGGWHFSYLGDIKTKIESFAHTEFNRDDIKSEENIRQALEEGKDIYGRENIRFEQIDIFSEKNVHEYPKELTDLIRQYPQFLKRKKSPYKDVNGNDIYEGDTVKGVGKHEGQSEVFLGYGRWQPFDYLNDYEGSNYEIVKQ